MERHEYGSYPVAPSNDSLWCWRISGIPESVPARVLIVLSLERLPDALASFYIRKQWSIEISQLHVYEVELRFQSIISTIGNESCRGTYNRDGDTNDQGPYGCPAWPHHV